MPPKKSNLSTTGGPSRGGGRGARGSQSTSTRGAARGGRGRGGRPQNPPAQTQDADDDDEDEDEDGHAGQQTTTQAQGRGQAKRRRAPNDDDEEPTGATRRRVDNTTQVTSHAPATSTDWDRVAQHVLNQPLPVERRAAYPPTQGPTPAPRNAEERNERIQALRNQLRVPYALGDLLLVGFLNGSGWDVNRAAALFWEGENRDIGLGSQTVPFGAPLRSTQQATPAAAAGPQLPPIPPPPTVINTVRRGENVEQGRILLVVDMQLGLRSSAFANRPRLRTTNANMTLLLHENRWVRDDASHEVSRRNGDYDTLTERMARLRISTEDENSRDERLALLISITSTNSWYSARRLLETNNWDLALAIDEWIRRGGVPLVDAPAQTRKDREEYKRNGRRSWNANKPRRMLGSKFYDDDEEKDPLGPPETEIEGGDSKPLKRAQPGQGTTNVDAGGNARNTTTTTTKRVSRRGFLIDANRDRAIIGATDASKLRLEYIRDGRYRYEHFDGADPDDDQRTKRSNFRWKDKKIWI